MPKFIACPDCGEKAMHRDKFRKDEVVCYKCGFLGDIEDFNFKLTLEDFDNELDRIMEIFYKELEKANSNKKIKISLYGLLRFLRKSYEPFYFFRNNEKKIDESYVLDEMRKKIGGINESENLYTCLNCGNPLIITGSRSSHSGLIRSFLYCLDCAKSFVKSTKGKEIKIKETSMIRFGTATE